MNVVSGLANRSLNYQVIIPEVHVEPSNVLTEASESIVSGGGCVVVASLTTLAVSQLV